MTTCIFACQKSIVTMLVIPQFHDTEHIPQHPSSVIRLAPAVLAEKQDQILLCPHIQGSQKQCKPTLPKGFPSNQTPLFSFTHFRSTTVTAKNELSMHLRISKTSLHKSFINIQYLSPVQSLTCYRALRKQLTLTERQEFRSQQHWSYTASTRVDSNTPHPL